METETSNTSNMNLATEVFKTKILIKRLATLQGTAGSSSVITLILPPGEQISKVSGMLTNEFGTASNIKSRTTRLSVLDALTSAQQRLKLFSKVPPKGLVVLCGNVEMPTESGSKEKRLTLSFEPPKPMKTFLYKCDNHFHLDAVLEALEGDGTRIGIIVMCGEGTLYAVITDAEVRVISEFKVDLPKKHGRGGQSKLRFERLANEARHNFVTKTAEGANRTYLTHNQLNVQKLLITGNGPHKEKLAESSILDYRLKKIICPTIIDVSYPSFQGLQEALNQAKDLLRGSRLDLERSVLQSFYEAISLDSKDVCYGLRDTLYVMDENVISKIYVSSECSIKIPLSGVKDEVLRAELEGTLIGEDTIPFLEYAISYGKKYEIPVVVISNSTAEGDQFLKGFGGIGGRLRYKLDLVTLLDHKDDKEGDDFDDEDEVWWDEK